MTSIRCRLLNGVAGALLVLSLSGAGCQSHTATEPIGKLSREDTIAFLILSDQLHEFRNAGADTTLCVAVETSNESPGKYFNPSNALMERLRETPDPGPSSYVLKQDSDCERNGAEPVDKASGRRAFVVFVSRARESEFLPKECGQYLGGWHGGAMYGGGNFYAVEENAGAVSVSRTNCEHFE